MVRQVQKTLKVEDITLINELYPRERVNWMTTYKYSEAMKSGSKFPPIVVAFLNKKYVLVDGWHRLQAMKNNGVEKVFCDVRVGMDKTDIFKEAIKLNIRHGQPFSSYDLTRSILKLKRMKVPKGEISSIINMPVEKIERFMSKRITYVTGQAVAIKKPLRHLMEQEISKKIINDQDNFRGQSQISLLEELITILKNGWLDTSNKVVAEKMEELMELIGSIKIPVDKESKKSKKAKKPKKSKRNKKTKVKSHSQGRVRSG